MAVAFYCADVSYKLPKRTALKKFIADTYRLATGKRLVLTYIFCSDEYLLDLNRRHLGHDYYTDIITFDLSRIPSTTSAEIYISIDRIRDNATKLNIDIQDEMLRVLLHGVLHLVGYHDHNKKQKELMRKMEEEWMMAYNLS